MLTRRRCLWALGALPALASLPHEDHAFSAFSGDMDTSRWREQFPVLSQRINEQPLVYLDSAATAQKPQVVIDALKDYYSHANANPSPSTHTLAVRAHDLYEDARKTVARFINAQDSLEIVWTRGTTEAINLVAAAWGSRNLSRNDEIILTISEHSSAMLPWQIAAERAQANVKYLDVDDDGQLRLEHLDQLLSSKTKLVCFPHVSNVLGIINPAKEICRRAKAAGAHVMIDAAQSVPHIPIDVQELGCDFLAFSGHKMMGPMGVGVLWAKRAILDRMPPYQSGSNMAHDADLASVELSPGALKFGAGTPNVGDAVALAAAVRFIAGIGFDKMRQHELAITRHARQRLASIKGVRVLGDAPAERRISLFSFTKEARTVGQLVAFLDARGIAIRGGDLASLPCLKRFGTTRAARASGYLYTTEAEIDRFADALALA